MTNAERFDDRVDAYVAARPSYPPESVDAIIAGLGAPASLTVADLGAGTGISARAIAQRGPFVIAIEPNASMRAAAVADPRVRFVDGTAEATTLDAASVDAVVAFQAWHWVDHPAAVAEARRIVRPGGVLAVVYNERDESDPFTASYGSIVRRFAQDDTEERRAAALASVAAIDPSQTQTVRLGNAQALDRAGVHARAESSSYLPKSGDAAAAMHVAIDDLLDGFAGPPFTMRLVTLVVRVEL